MARWVHDSSMPGMRNISFANHGFGFHYKKLHVDRSISVAPALHLCGDGHSHPGNGIDRNPPDAN
jgi:hypothetical protein